MAAGAAPSNDLTGISFSDQLWLNSYPLDRGLVFDYFALSPFYDRSCNNEQLRARSIHPLDAAHLCKMTGMEYMLYEVQEPNLFVFRKQKRESVDKVTPLAAYYVLDGVIYQAPLLYNVVCSRLVRCLHHISNAFANVAEKLEDVGHDGSEGEDDSKTEEAKKTVLDLKEAVRLDQILGTVLRKLPPAPPPPMVPPPSGGVPEQPTELQKAPKQEQDESPAAKKLKTSL